MTYWIHEILNSCIMNILSCIKMTFLPLCVMWQSQWISICQYLNQDNYWIDPGTRDGLKLFHQNGTPCNTFAVQYSFAGPSHSYLQDLEREPRQAAAAPRRLQNFAYFILNSIGIMAFLTRENKRPKGPHIVHLSTISHLFDRSARRKFLFTHRPEKHKLGRGRWDLASRQVSLNSVQRFQRRSKNVSTNQRPGRPSCFSNRQEKHKLIRGRWDICFLSSFVEFCSAVSEEKSKMSQPIRGQGSHLVFPIGQKKHKLGRGCWDLASCQVSLNSIQRFQRRSRKCLSQSEPGRPSCFPIGPKNTNLVEDVEILLPVKFRWIPFGGFRGEVENVSANQRPGRPSCFSDRPKKTQTW